MDERHTRVSDLLHEAAETHCRAFRSELLELLGGKVVRSELTWLLVRLDKEYTQRRPDQRWRTTTPSSWSATSAPAESLV
jgi:hypothetical protein